MQFQWNKDTIGWYKDAEDFSGFYRNLARAMYPALEGHGSFCDMGCGLGLLDLALSDRMERITCVDTSLQAIASLDGQLRERNIKNIRTAVADCRRLPGSWDVICLCFFSSIRIKPFLDRCKKLVAVVSGGGSQELFPGRYRRERQNTIEGEIMYLDNLGLDYKLSRHSWNFGQPLRSVEDARRYVRGYAPEIGDRELTDFLTARLLPIDHGEFHYCLPREKTVAIFEIPGRG